MICHPNAYPSGHAGCCGCTRDINLASAPSGFSCTHGNIEIYFIFCADCFCRLQAGGEQGCKNAIAKVVKQALSALPNRTGFAMTTSLALRAHGGDLVKACDVGVSLPRVLHEAIAQGEADAVFLPPLCWEVA